ncbi:MAG: F0F1 ATP synthase subunit B [Tannerella sp.]|nr:F0F1 ATP synthase subunit B [Tannerella sp.]
MMLLSPDPGLIFWMLISFGVVFFILAKFGFPVIVKMVDERKSFIDNSLESAKTANERLLKIQEESEQILKQARENEMRMLKELQETRSKVIKEAKEQASIEAKKLIAEAQIAIQKEKDLAVKDIRNQIVDLSIEIAEKVLRKNLDNPPAQRELVQKLIEEVQKN